MDGAANGVLVRKRALAGALWQPDTTTGGIHLSPAGHPLMAETMWALIKAPYRGG